MPPCIRNDRKRVLAGLNPDSCRRNPRITRMNTDFPRENPIP